MVSWAVMMVVEIEGELIGFSAGLDKGQVEEEGCRLIPVF